MIVKVGFNTDFGRDKFDVGLDETDLARILTEHGLAPDAPLTLIEAFQVLQAAAGMFCAAQLVSIDPSEEHRLAVKRHREQLTSRLTGIRSRLEAIAEVHEAYEHP